jgi:WD40 repeat protein
MALDGSLVVLGNPFGRVVVVPLEGGPVRRLEGFADMIGAIAVGPHARLVAAGSGVHVRDEALVRVWDLESDEVRVLDAGDGVRIQGLEFTDEGDLWVLSRPKLRLWSLDRDEPHIVDELDLSEAALQRVRRARWCELDADAGSAVFWRDDRLWSEDLRTHEVRELGRYTGPVDWCWLVDDRELVLAGDGEDGIRVGRLSGGEFHLLLGRVGGGVHVSPDGRWIASGGPDNSIRLWPVPDLDTPPLHTLPLDELLPRLESLTNLRVVEDPDSPSGWRLDVGPFPGWETVPTW